MAAPGTRKAVRKKSAPPAAAGERTISRQLYELRKAAGLSQEAIGSQGFVSTPGWIKIENGQRMPSERLLEALMTFLIGEKVIRANQKEALLDELCTLKYVAHRSPFLAQLAKAHLKTLVPVVVSK